MSFFDQAVQTYIASFETICLRIFQLTPVWGSLSPWQLSESKRMVSEKKRRLAGEPTRDCFGALVDRNAR